MFTNPLEIIKIRLQTAGENASMKGMGAWSVIKELGFKGLYKVGEGPLQVEASRAFTR